MSTFLSDPCKEQSYIVENLEVDFTNYSGTKDFQVLAEYCTPTTCKIITKRLDTTNPECGWEEDLQILLNTDTDGETPEEIHIIRIGSSPASNIKIIEFTVTLDTTILRPSSTITSNEILNKYTSYNPLKTHHIHYRSLEEFNHIFQTDIVRLPANMFAFGIKDGAAYKHHDSYGGYHWTYEINLTINHIVSVAYNKTPNRCPDDFYFVICSHDGYMEHHYPSSRTIPYIPKPDEYINKVCLTMREDQPNSYPLLHKNKLILGQSVHPDTLYTIAVLDRYYLCLNRYTLYHGVHGGIPFHKKIGKIIYAGNPRGDKYNFTRRRDIEISPREYFKASSAVVKLNIDCPEQISREDMINYKYILDIDGNASTWDATAWKLNSNSVIFKSDSNWAQWFYEDYKPWIHYVPVADDFTDIQEKFNWCEKNQEKCIEIIKNAKVLFKEIYSHQNVVKYTESLLDKWNIYCNENI